MTISANLRGLLTSNPDFMAFNWQTFKTRTLTAAIFVVVMLAGLLINRWTFFILFLIIHFGCWSEYLTLIKKIYSKKYLLYALLGIAYITVPIVLLIMLRNSYQLIPADGSGHLGEIIPLALIFSLWINDTMAYIVGSIVGRTPLSKISPKKTWEGTIGGIILTIIVTGFLVFPILWTNYGSDVTLPSFKKFHWFAIPAIAAIAGVAGDLFESKLKRMAGVKDSGHIMPGHGGFLDRFDSLLVAAPFVSLYVFLFMR